MARGGGNGIASGALEVPVEALETTQGLEGHAVAWQKRHPSLPAFADIGVMSSPATAGSTEGEALTLQEHSKIWSKSHRPLPVFEGTGNAWLAYNALQSPMISSKRAGKRLDILRSLVGWPTFRLGRDSDSC